jgi:hypothetical protein
MGSQRIAVTVWYVNVYSYRIDMHWHEGRWEQLKEHIHDNIGRGGEFRSAVMAQ